MNNLRAATIIGMAFLAILLMISPSILSQRASAEDATAGVPAPKAQEISAEDAAAGVPTPSIQRSEEIYWKYGLSLVIAALTGIGSIFLICRTFPQNAQDQAESIQVGMLGLYMIAVALVVEAVLICCILGVDVKKYEAIYAAIAGYVLGSLGGKQDKLAGAGNSKDSAQ